MANSMKALSTRLLLLTALAVLLVPAVAFPQGAPITGAATVFTSPTGPLFLAPSTTFTVDLHVDLTAVTGTCNAAAIPAALGGYTLVLEYDNTQVNYVSRAACPIEPGQSIFGSPLTATAPATANAAGAVAFAGVQTTNEFTPTGDVCVARVTFTTTAGFNAPGPLGTLIVPDCDNSNTLPATQSLATPGPDATVPPDCAEPQGVNIPIGTCNGTNVALLVAAADLSLVKTDSADPVVINTNYSYTLTVTNAGPDPSTGGTVIDTLPVGVTFVSASAGCVNAAGTVTCTMGVIPSGGTQVFTITVTAPGTAQVLTNTADVNGNEDVNPANDVDTETTTIIAVVAVVPVPTLSQWGLLALGLMLALLGYATLRRRQTQA